MRSRRLLALRQRQRPPSESSPTIRTRIYPKENPNNDNQHTLKNLPFPTLFSPRHPNSSRIENGLSKYTTGILQAPRSLQRSLDTGTMALKVYSTNPLALSTITKIRSLLEAQDQSPAPDFNSVLRKVYDISARLHQASEDVVDSWFQLFRSFETLRPLKLPWTVIDRASRFWNLYCQLYRPSAKSGISRPHIGLQIINIAKIGRVKSGPFARTDNRLQIVLLGHLRASFFQREHLEDHSKPQSTNAVSGHSFQSIVDDILYHCARTVAGTMFTEHIDLCAKLKDAILLHLQSSKLRTVLDFNVLEITLRHQKGHRYVLNTMLNPDATELSHPHLDETRQGKLNYQASDSNLDGDLKEQANKITLSEQTMEKIGIRDVNCQILRHKESDQPSVTPNELIFEFDRICRGLNEAGLTSCLLSLQPLAQRFQDVHAQIKGYFLHSEPRSYGDHAQISLMINGTDPPGLKLGFPHLLKGRATIADARETSLDVMYVGLFYRLLGEPTTKSDWNERRRLSAADESEVLSQAVRSVCEKVLSSTVFQSYHDVAQKLAQATLRTLGDASPGMELYKVEFNIQDPDGSGTVSKASAGCEVPSAVTFGTAADVSGTYSSIADRPHDVSESDHTYARPEEVAPPESNFVQPAFVLEKTGRVYHLRTPVAIQSEALEAKTGLDKFYFVGTGPKSIDIPYLTGTTSQMLSERLEQALPASSVSGMSCLERIFATISAISSDWSSVKMIFYKLHLPEHDDSIGAGESSASVHVRSETTSAGKHRHPLLIDLPPLQTPDCVDKEDNEDARVYVKTDLYGTSPQPRPAEEDNAVIQLSALQRSIGRIVSENLSGRTFNTASEMSSMLADVIYRQRSEFDEIIDVKMVNVKTMLKKGNYNSPSISSARSMAPAIEQKERVGSNEIREKQAVVDNDLSQPEVVHTEAGTEEGEAEGDNNRSSTAEARAFIALGSNVGNRLENIEKACREMDADPDIRVTLTSPLYETDPMYVSDQDRFLNGACEIRTTLEPHALLQRLKAIEERLGRVKLVEKGPRNIDLDILIYENRFIESEELIIPHPLVSEREFVLRPLSDIPSATNRHLPTSFVDRRLRSRFSIREMLERLPKSSSSMHSMLSLGPISQHIRVNEPKRATRIMSILNTTPDSFSDGGDNEITDTEKLRETIRAQIAAGATLIDIGGQSSRPNAPDVTVEDEIARVLPAIEAIKSLSEAADLVISVDTYRAAVAEAAVNAGASIINDISAGKLDPEMLPTIARLGCTYIMMHMRGTPATMMSEENCTYSGGLMKDISDELYEQTDAAMHAGIRRWRIILDPGIGFSKTPEQNMEILRRLPYLQSRLSGYPWLVGTSRKSFIGKITGVQEPKERVWGTAATVTAAVQGGADIVRVHDVQEMATVVKMADAMYRV